MPAEKYIIKPFIKGGPIPLVDAYTYMKRNLKPGNKNVAFIDTSTDTSYTYEEAAKILFLIEQYIFRYVNPGSNGKLIAVYLPTCAHYTLLVLAAWRFDATAVLINRLLTPGEVKKNLAVCKAPILITTQNALPHDFSTEHRLRIFHLESILSFIANPPPTSFLLPNVHHRSAETVALILYSSGTTGAPKAVQLTHRAIVAHSIDQCHPHIQYASPTKELIFMSLAHVFGINISMVSLYTGIPQILMPKFDLRKYLHLVSTHQVSLLHVVPPVAVLLAKSPLVDEYDITCVNDMMCGAAPLSAELVKQVMARFPNLKHIRQGYGMTETEGGVCFGPADQFKHKDVHGTVGILVPSVEAKIADPDTGRALPPMATGEVCVRGPVIMKGYLNNDTATRQTIDQHGWLHTGDLGYYDGKAFFYVVDRLKELIKYKGYQVAPAELEAVLLKHPGIADAAVIGQEDEESGQLPRAWVVRKPSNNLTEKEVKDYVKGFVAPYKQLRGGVRFVDSIPKSASGKILRREIMKEKINAKL